MNIIPPLSIHAVMLVLQLLDVVFELLEKWRIWISVELLHHFVKVCEEGQVLDSLFVADGVETGLPDFLVVDF